MSDPTAAKRLRTEAKAACTTLEDAAKTLLGWADSCALISGHTIAYLTAPELRTLAHALAHQGGRLDMAVSMAHTRRKR